MSHNPSMVSNAARVVRDKVRNFFRFSVAEVDADIT